MHGLFVRAPLKRQRDFEGRFDVKKMLRYCCDATSGVAAASVLQSSFADPPPVKAITKEPYISQILNSEQSAAELTILRCNLAAALTAA
jgi:hypothetical protein